MRILYLGHRDGSEVMVRKDLKATTLRDLRGKVFAIPSKYSNQYLVITKLLEEQGIRKDEIQFIEMAPHDMPGALAAKAIDAYFIGEPHAARAELDGSGRVLYYAKISGRSSFRAFLLLTNASWQRVPQLFATWCAASPKAGSGPNAIVWTPPKLPLRFSGRMRTCFVSC